MYAYANIIIPVSSSNSLNAQFSGVSLLSIIPDGNSIEQVLIGGLKLKIKATDVILFDFINARTSIPSTGDVDNRVVRSTVSQH